MNEEGLEVALSPWREKGGVGGIGEEEERKVLPLSYSTLLRARNCRVLRVRDSRVLRVRDSSVLRVRDSSVPCVLDSGSRCYASLIAVVAATRT